MSSMISRRTLLWSGLNISCASSATADILSLAKRTRFNSGVNLALFFGYGPVPAMVNSSFRLLTSNEINELVNFGVTTVRIPIRWEQLQPYRGEELDAGIVAVLSSAISRLHAAGISSTIDIHNSFKYSMSRSNIGDPSSLIALGGGNLTVDQFVDLWVRLSTIYKSNPGVDRYDLMNEPQIPAQLTATAYQAAITAIRANGDAKEILIGSSSMNGDPSVNYAAANPNYPLKDTANNTSYSMHVYPMGTGSSTDYGAADALALGLSSACLVGKCASFYAFLRAHGVKGHIGEYAVGQDGIIWSTMNKALHDFARVADIPMLAWSYDVAGPNDPNNLKDVSGRVAAQWTVMASYNGRQVPSSCAIVAAAKGSCSSQVNVSIDLRGVVPRATTYRLSDNGAGGTFSPASVTFAAGSYNGYATVQYQTPANDKTVTLSATNASGLLNPANATLTVSGSKASTAYSPPSLDGKAPKVAARWVSTPSFFGAKSTGDIVSGSPAVDAAGLKTSRGGMSFSNSVKTLLCSMGPATLMVEVASFAGAQPGNRIVGPGPMIYGGNASTVAYVSDFSTGAQAGSGVGASQPQRIALAWDGSELKLSVGGGDVVTKKTGKGMYHLYLGSSDGSQDIFPNEIRALAIWNFKASDAGLKALSSDMTT